ncbi:GFA family protein [Qipengyuania zhejiangensis]|uniref:GFA family protein n=1 Tax=Qipengyuania zhejiangensis TaxID=3077782 RepID=UPI002D78F404|nr:GFA family protein [Qipengyuania sp. Z2]
MKVEGGCHCRKVRFAIEIEPPVTLLACNCSICTMTGFLHLIVPQECFTLVAGGEALTSYRFGTGKAEHLFCQTCGVKSFYRPRSHPESFSVSFHCLDNPEAIEAVEQPFDGRNWDAARQLLAKQEAPDT